MKQEQEQNDGADPRHVRARVLRIDPRHVRARVLRIDPVARTVTPAVDSWFSALEWIGADLLERVGCGSGVDLWIDEEGMLKGRDDHWILGGDQMIAGRAVLVGGVGGEWSDLPIPPEVGAGAVGWIPAAFHSRAREIADGMRPVALPWNDEGMAQLAKMQREHRGWIEMLAVASEPARLKVDEAIDLGDCVTCPDGLTGFVESIDGAVLSVRMPDGVRRYRADEVVKVEEID